jgi:hypothetical protein
MNLRRYKRMNVRESSAPEVYYVIKMHLGIAKHIPK